MSNAIVELFFWLWQSWFLFNMFAPFEKSYIFIHLVCLSRFWNPDPKLRYPIDSKTAKVWKSSKTIQNFNHTLLFGHRLGTSIGGNWARIGHGHKRDWARMARPRRRTRYEQIEHKQTKHEWSGHERIQHGRTRHERTRHERIKHELCTNTDE